MNPFAFWLLRAGAATSLDVQGAYLEVPADLLSSVGVLIAAVVVQLTGFALIDPIFAIGIGLFVVPRAWRLGDQALWVLLQDSPSGLDTRCHPGCVDEDRPRRLGA